MRRPRQFPIAAWPVAIAEEVGGCFWIYLLVQFFPNHADWCGVAAGQTLNKFNAVISVRADRYRIMHFFTITRALDSKTRAHVFHQFQSASHGATECATDPNMRFSGRMLTTHWIKNDSLENVDRLESQFIRDPEYGFVADESEMFLP